MSSEDAIRARLVDIQRLMRARDPGKRLEPWQLIGYLLARVAELESRLEEAG
jgi:hypothetical protein